MAEVRDGDGRRARDRDVRAGFGGGGGNAGGGGGGGNKPGAGGGFGMGGYERSTGMGAGAAGSNFRTAPDRMAEPAGTFLDKMLGYRTIGDRVAAYQRNPHRPGNGGIPVPNFPNADFLYGPLNFAMSAIPGGTAINALAKLRGGMNATPADMLGLSAGQQQGMWGAGRFNDQGDPGQMRMATPATAPITGPTGMAGAAGATGGATGGSTPLGSLLGSGQWNGMYRPIPGPTNYGVTLPSWSYNFTK